MRIFFYFNWYIIPGFRYCQNNLSCQWIVINWNYIRNNFFFFFKYFFNIYPVYIYFFQACIYLCNSAIKISPAILFMILLINVAVMCYCVHCVWCIKLNVADTVYGFLLDFSIIFIPNSSHTVQLVWSVEWKWGQK